MSVLFSRSKMAPKVLPGWWASSWCHTKQQGPGLNHSSLITIMTSSTRDSSPEQTHLHLQVFNKIFSISKLKYIHLLLGLSNSTHYFRFNLQILLAIFSFPRLFHIGTILPRVSTSFLTNYIVLCIVILICTRDCVLDVWLLCIWQQSHLHWTKSAYS